MTAPIIEETWAPEGWDAPSNVCELTLGGMPACEVPAQIAFRYACCGYIKLMCVDHFAWLLHPNTLGGQYRLTCRGCKTTWRDRDFYLSYWRI